MNQFGGHPYESPHDLIAYFLNTNNDIVSEDVTLSIYSKGFCNSPSLKLGLLQLC